MHTHQWVTSLLRLPRVQFQHWIEFIFCIAALIRYDWLKRQRLTGLFSLLVAVLVIDVVLDNTSTDTNIRVLQAIWLFVFLYGLSFIKSIKAKNIGLAVPLVGIYVAADFMGFEFASRGWYNLFIDNLYWVATAPLFFILFYKMLQLTYYQKRWYLIITTASVLFFIWDYISHDNLKYNISTLVIFDLQHVILCCLIVGKLAIDPNTPTRLIDHPYFWICTGRMAFALTGFIIDGLHPYLVENFIEVYQSKVILKIRIYSSLVLALCYLYAFILCRKQYLRPKDLVTGRRIA
jgi:hypothetical protein